MSRLKEKRKRRRLDAASHVDILAIDMVTEKSQEPVTIFKWTTIFSNGLRGSEA
ncbi:MAG TPA: hypothetical protein VEG44_00170 [Candidatus Acidoferrales bacterium]|nr:hypothetical protein [Candidatus Acidoferrales bacterium]